MDSVAETLRGLTVPHLDQYFGVWAILEDTLRAALARVEKLNLRAHVEIRQGRRSRTEAASPEPKAISTFGDYELTADGVAIIELTGPLMKFASSLSGGTSTVAARRNLRLAIADERVKAIALRIDSPGGTVSGTKDLADDVASAAAKKPLMAYIEDLGASAAYWIASQAETIACNPTAMVGSIGTYAVLADSSAQAKKKGLVMHVVRAGDFKGMGVPGTPVTDEQLAEMQRLVDDLNSHFLQAVAAGRNLPAKTVAGLADGRVHVGVRARELGLVDVVQSFDEALASLTYELKAPAGVRAADVSDPLSDGAATMADSPATATPVAKPVLPVPATLADLKTAFPKAGSDFLLAQLERGATIEQARAAWSEILEARSEAQAQEIEKLKAAANKPGVSGITDRRPGTAATAAEPTGDVLSQWEEAVAAEQTRCKGDRAKAIRNVVRANPDLHTAYVQASNASKKSR